MKAFSQTIWIDCDEAVASETMKLACRPSPKSRMIELNKSMPPALRSISAIARFGSQPKTKRAAIAV